MLFVLPEGLFWAFLGGLRVETCRVRSVKVAPCVHGTRIEGGPESATIFSLSVGFAVASGLASKRVQVSRILQVSLLPSTPFLVDGLSASG